MESGSWTSVELGLTWLRELSERGDWLDCERKNRGHVPLTLTQIYLIGRRKTHGIYLIKAIERRVMRPCSQ